jgi:hypothetical protein
VPSAGAVVVSSVDVSAGGVVAGFAQPLMTIAVTTSIKAINFFIFYVSLKVT